MTFHAAALQRVSTRYGSGPNAVPEDEKQVKLTEDSHAAACDIHNILRKYKDSGVIEHVNKGEPLYFDAVGVPTFQESMQIVAEATSAFAQLPATMRAEYENDPAKWLDAMQNEEVRESHYPSDEAEQPAEAVKAEPVVSDVGTTETPSEAPTGA